MTAGALHVSGPIRDISEVRTLHDIRSVAKTLGLKFPLTEKDAENVATLVRKKQMQRERIAQRLNSEIPAVKHAQAEADKERARNPA